MTTYAYETPRLWLEKMTVEDHLEDFTEQWNNPEALIWSTQGVKTTLEEARAWMLFQMPSAENPDIDKYAILLRPVEGNPELYLNSKGRPKMIGMVGTNRYSDQGLESGYCINIKYWGRGYASEAFAAFLSLFWTLEIRKGVKELVAKIDPGNIPSQRIVMRVGARRGEILKDWYSRVVDMGKKRDIECWYIERPGASESEIEVWKDVVRGEMVKKKEAERVKEERERILKDNAGAVEKEGFEIENKIVEKEGNERV